MPFLFVHGVNNRQEDPDYETHRLIIEEFLIDYFRNIPVNGKVMSDVRPRFPYWGDLGATFKWDMASLPSGTIDALGGKMDENLRTLLATLHEFNPQSDGLAAEPLLETARRSFPRAVDIVVELAAMESDAALRKESARFVLAAQRYAEQFETAPPPAWLANVSTDEQFCDLLTDAITNTDPNQGVNALGFAAIGNLLQSGAGKLKAAAVAAAGTVLDRVGDFASTKVLAWTRRSLNGTVGRFFGDVFFYLDGRGDEATPGKIPLRILDVLDSEIAVAPKDEPLIIMGHSLGAVICYDLLTHFRPGIQVDLFISVGSQVSHFEEMKLFKASQQGIPGPGVPLASKPANIRHWINVFDVVDIFSYSCKDVFADVVDFGYDTRTYVGKAHGAYFMQSRFYDRLRKRAEACA